MDVTHDPPSSIKYLKQLISHQHASVSACCPVGVDVHHKHTHAGAISVPCQAQTEASLAFLQLDHVQDSREVVVALDNVLWKNQMMAEGSSQVGGRVSADTKDFLKAQFRLSLVSFYIVISRIESGLQC